MSLWDGIRYRLRALAHPTRHARELADEMDVHLELETQRQAQRRNDSVQAEAARFAARRRFGNATYLREEARRMTALEWLDTVKRDVQFAARSFRRTPGFTTIVVVTLGLGVGANTAIFSALRVLLFRPLPFDRPEQLMKVSLTRAGNATRGAGASDDIVWSVPKFTMLRDQQHVFSELGMFSNDEVTIGGDPHAAERVESEAVRGRYFETLRVRPIIGRSFAPEELDHAGAAPTVIISEGDTSAQGTAVRRWRDGSANVRRYRGGVGVRNHPRGTRAGAASGVGRPDARAARGIDAHDRRRVRREAATLASRCVFWNGTHTPPTLCVVRW